MKKLKSLSLKQYIPIIVVGSVVYFIMQKYVFAGKSGNKTGDKAKNKLTEYYKKMYGDNEKQIQAESPEKLMFNIRE